MLGHTRSDMQTHVQAHTHTHTHTNCLESCSLRYKSHINKPNTHTYLRMHTHSEGSPNKCNHVERRRYTTHTRTHTHKHTYTHALGNSCGEMIEEMWRNCSFPANHIHSHSCTQINLRCGKALDYVLFNYLLCKHSLTVKKKKILSKFDSSLQRVLLGLHWHVSALSSPLRICVWQREIGGEEREEGWQAGYSVAQSHGCPREAGGKGWQSFQLQGEKAERMLGRCYPTPQWHHSSGGLCLIWWGIDAFIQNGV